VNSSRSRGEVLGELSSIRKSSFHRAAYPTKCCKNVDLSKFAARCSLRWQVTAKRTLQALRDYFRFAGDSPEDTCTAILQIAVLDSRQLSVLFHYRANELVGS
jgi:hypothetical protein